MGCSNMVHAQSRMVLKNRLDKTIVEFNIAKKVKYRLSTEKKTLKGRIEALDEDWIQIDGRKIPMDDFLEIRSWATKKAPSITIPAAVVSGGGALLTVAGIAGTIDGASAEKSGYNSLGTALAVTTTLVGATVTYFGWRWLKRKRIKPREWELLTWK